MVGQVQCQFVEIYGVWLVGGLYFIYIGGYIGNYKVYWMIVDCFEDLCEYCVFGEVVLDEGDVGDVVYFEDV